LDERSIDEARLPLHANWEPVRLIGAGGMSYVYEVVDASGDWSAVKVLSDRPGSLLQAQAEFEMTKAAGAVSPKVVRVFEVGLLEDERAYVRMELLVGRSLGEAWAQRREANSACLTVARVARALHPAHEAGLIHCDLKPENIFLQNDGQIRLLDFGFSRHCADEAGFAGTLCYTAPELLVSETTQPTSQSDVYSLGAVLYEGLSGVRPFAGSTYPAVLLAIHAGAFVDVKDRAPRTRERYAEIVRRAMHLDPAERFSSMHELANAIDEARSEDSTPPRPPSLRPGAGSPEAQF
jgi:serine/threonine protein kinase